MAYAIMLAETGEMLTVEADEHSIEPAVTRHSTQGIDTRTETGGETVIRFWNTGHKRELVAVMPFSKITILQRV